MGSLPCVRRHYRNPLAEYRHRKLHMCSTNIIGNIVVGISLLLYANYSNICFTNVTGYIFFTTVMGTTVTGSYICICWRTTSVNDYRNNNNVGHHFFAGQQNTGQHLPEFAGGMTVTEYRKSRVVFSLYSVRRGARSLNHIADQRFRF